MGRLAVTTFEFEQFSNILLAVSALLSCGLLGLLAALLRSSHHSSAPGPAPGSRYRRDAADSRRPSLTPQERAALQLLEHADGALCRWPVPRAVATSLRRRHLVALTAHNQQVVLTPFGRDALTADRHCQAAIRAEYRQGIGIGTALMLAARNSPQPHSLALPYGRASRAAQSTKARDRSPTPERPRLGSAPKAGRA